MKEETQEDKLICKITPKFTNHFMFYDIRGFGKKSLLNNGFLDVKHSMTPLLLTGTSSEEGEDVMEVDAVGYHTGVLVGEEGDVLQCLIRKGEKRVFTKEEIKGEPVLIVCAEPKDEDES